MNGLCPEVRSFHGMFIHDLFFVFGSDGWMVDDGDVGE